MPTPTGLSLTDETTRETAREGKGGLVALVVLLSATIAGLGYLGFQMLQRMDAVERQLAVLQARSEAAAAEARAAADRASTAVTAAKAAAEGRVWAEAQTADARHEADTARQDATAAQQDAATAREAAARAQAEAEAHPQEGRGRGQAPGVGARTDRRDAAHGARPGDEPGQRLPEVRVRQGRAATRGSRATEPNRRDPDDLARLHGLGERPHRRRRHERVQPEALRAPRAGGTRLSRESGMSPDILSVEGHGKQLPLVKGGTDAARAKNRRVELGIATPRSSTESSNKLHRGQSDVRRPAAQRVEERREAQIDLPRPRSG